MGPRVTPMFYNVQFWTCFLLCSDSQTFITKDSISGFSVSGTKTTIDVYVTRLNRGVQPTKQTSDVPMSSLCILLQFCVELNQGTLASVRKWKRPRGLWKSVVSEKPTGRSGKVLERHVCLRGRI